MRILNINASTILATAIWSMADNIGSKGRGKTSKTVYGQSQGYLFKLGSA